MRHTYVLIPTDITAFGLTAIFRLDYLFGWTIFCPSLVTVSAAPHFWESLIAAEISSSVTRRGVALNFGCPLR